MRSGLLVAAVSLLGACGADASSADGVASGSELRFAATLDPTPEASVVQVVWTVSSGSPDYVYVWGRAVVEGDRYVLALPTRPPDEAMNSYGLGVGQLALVPQSAMLPEGRLQDRDALNVITGVTPQHAIIYVDVARAQAAIDEQADQLSPEKLQQAREAWFFDFDPGYSCGEGRPASGDEVFDTFAPVDCSEIEMVQGDLSNVRSTNWT